MTPTQKENLLKIRAIALAFAALPINLWRFFENEEDLAEEPNLEATPQCLLGHFFGSFQALDEGIDCDFAGLQCLTLFGLSHRQAVVLFSEGDDPEYAWSSGHACVKYIDSILKEAEANGQTD